MACSAAEAMVSDVNESCDEPGVVKVPDMRGNAVIQGEPEDLVEIAVKEGTVPSHAYQMPAHDGVKGLGIEGTSKLVHVLFEATGPDKKILEPANRHVGEHIEAVERDMKPRFQFFLKFFF